MLKLAADFSRGCALAVIVRTFLLIHPRRFANRHLPAEVAAKANGANDMPSAPFVRSGVNEALAHKLVAIAAAAVNDLASHHEAVLRYPWAL